MKECNGTLEVLLLFGTEGLNGSLLRFWDRSFDRHIYHTNEGVSF